MTEEELATKRRRGQTGREQGPRKGLSRRGQQQQGGRLINTWLSVFSQAGLGTSVTPTAGAR